MLGYSVAGAAIFSFLVFMSYATEDPLSDINTANNLPQIVRAPDVNRQFDWAGEIVPSTADAKERLDRELMVNSYYHSSTLQVLKLSNRYFPLIERILREHGIPDDFKSVSYTHLTLPTIYSV